VDSLSGYGEVFYRNAVYSGVMPQISAIMGPCAGGAVYSPAMTDFVLMTKGTSFMFITGPEVIKSVTKEDVTFEQLGGADVHNRKSGVAHLEGEDDKDTLKKVRELLSYMPQSALGKPPTKETDDPIDREVPQVMEIVHPDQRKPYPMVDVIKAIVDEHDFFEIQPNFAKNILTV